MTRPHSTLVKALGFSGLAIALLSAGCSDQQTTAPVTGKVTLNGQPLTSGRVEFQSEKHGIIARGEIQSDGTYRLWTYNENSPDGAVLGMHKIAVKAFQEEPAQTAGSDEEPGVGKPAVPKKYILPATSGLTAEVKEGPNDIPIPLEGQVPQ